MERYRVLLSVMGALVLLVVIGFSLQPGRDMTIDMVFVPQRDGQEHTADLLLFTSLDLLAEDMDPEGRGIVIEAAELVRASDQQLVLLSKLVDNGLLVFAVGEGVCPGLLAEQLGIMTTQTAMPGNYSQLLADGLCLRPGGMIQAITVAAPSGWKASPERILQDVETAIDVITQGNLLYSSPLVHDSEQWTLVGLATHLFDASGLGTYTSTVACYRLNATADGDDHADYWQLLAQHSALRGSQPYTSARSALMPGAGQAVAEYDATEVGAAATSAQTRLINKSDPALPRIEHQLGSGSTRHSSGTGFAWGQTVLLSTPQGEQKLSLTFANNLRFTWPRDEFLDEWACQFSK